MCPYNTPQTHVEIHKNQIPPTAMEACAHMDNRGKTEINHRRVGSESQGIPSENQSFSRFVT